VIIKPLKQILFFDKNSDNLLFKIDCLGGRSKWKESTNVLSLKFQVSNKVEETAQLNKLEQNDLHFNLEIIGYESSEASVRIRFCDYTITKLELRSYTMTFNKDEDSYWRYFIEGNAKDLVTII